MAAPSVPVWSATSAALFPDTADSRRELAPRCSCARAISRADRRHVQRRPPRSSRSARIATADDRRHLRGLRSPGGGGLPHRSPRAHAARRAVRGAVGRGGVLRPPAARARPYFDASAGPPEAKRRARPARASRAGRAAPPRGTARLVARRATGPEAPVDETGTDDDVVQRLWHDTRGHRARAPGRAGGHPSDARVTSPQLTPRCLFNAARAGQGPAAARPRRRSVRVAAIARCRRRLR